MADDRIASVFAQEVLDSRGNPTVAVELMLEDGSLGAAKVPSGASTGTHEAHELRDGDPKRYRGQGCRKAVANVNGVIAAALRGKRFDHQGDLDATLNSLDGTADKSKLGANAILAVSVAFARAHAASHGQPLFTHLANLIGQPLRTLPRLTVNLFSGGKHAGGQMPIQDVLVVPAAPTVHEGLAVVYDVFQAAAELTQRKYNVRPLRADEGGLAPPFASVEAALDDTMDSIRAAGHLPGRDVFIAIDVASSHFYEVGRYRLGVGPLTSDEMIERVAGWVDRYPVVSIEDGLAEDDWDNWPAVSG